MFTNQGKTTRIVRYEYPDGHSAYFTPEGVSIRKAFLRSPVNYTRISSRFSLKRKHPKLHKFRAHRGVDYAASRGTPIKASGDGKVEFICFSDTILAYVKSAMGYPAYYPVCWRRAGKGERARLKSARPVP